MRPGQFPLGLQPRRWLPTTPALASVFLLLLGSLPSLKAAPANDGCAGALVIPGIVGEVPYHAPVVDITTATSTDETSLMNGLCSGIVSRGVWYRFTPIQGGLYTVSTCSPSTTVGDTVLAVFTSVAGCAGPFTKIACEDDTCATAGASTLTTVTVQLFADTTYYIVAWQYDTVPPAPGKGLVEVTVTRELVPTNDSCESATPLLLNIPVSGSTIGGSNHYQIPSNTSFAGIGQLSSAAAGRDVVYSFTAPASARYSFKAANYNTAVGFDLVLYVTGDCPGGASPVIVTNCLAAANRNTASSAEEVVCLSMTHGQRVYVFVDDHAFNSGSSFNILVTRCDSEVETNGTPAEASTLSCGAQGGIASSLDEDFFILGDFPAGWRAFVVVDGESANLPNFDLRIVSGSTNTIEFDNNDNDEFLGKSSPNVAGTPLPGGPVFAFVSSSFAAEPYRIHAVVQPPLAAAAVESEPNNLIGDADSDNGYYFYGTLPGPAPSTDVDTFALSATDGDVLFLSLDADPLRDNTPINAKLELLDEFGNILVAANDPNASSSTNGGSGTFYASAPNSPAEAIVYYCPREGPYFARVSIGTASSGITGAGDYLLSISKNCGRGWLGQRHSVVMSNANVTSPVGEGFPATLSGTFADLDTGELLALHVTWGDGTSNDFRFPGGHYQWSVNHTYADDNPTDTPSDTYPISITVTDTDGNMVAQSLNITVTNVPPRLTNVSLSLPVRLGQVTTLTGLLSEPGALDGLNVTLEWGDGTAPQVLNLPPGTAMFSETHVYNSSPGEKTARLTISDDDHGTNEMTTVVRVSVPGSAATFTGYSYLPTPPPPRMQLQLTGTPYAIYRVERSTDLKIWTAIGELQAASDGAITLTDTLADPSSHFYRAVTD